MLNARPPLKSARSKTSELYPFAYPTARTLSLIYEVISSVTNVRDNFYDWSIADHVSNVQFPPQAAKFTTLRHTSL